MGKWRSKASYSRAPDDGALSPDEALAAAGGCTTLLPAAVVKGSINATEAAVGAATGAAPGTGSNADDRLLGTNGTLGWEAAAASAAAEDGCGAEHPELADRGAGNNNGRAPMHNGKANGHPPLCPPDTLSLARPPPGGGGGGGGGDGAECGSPASALWDTPDDMDPDDENLQCGLGPCTPRWLQIFASKQAFLVTFCIAWVLQGMYYTYFVSVITTIEKLLQIQSKTTGIIMSATEIGQIGSSLLLTYYGGQGHRPKWIAWGMVLFSVSSFTCAVPHFVFGRKMIEANDLLNMGAASVSDAYQTGNGTDPVGNVCVREDLPYVNMTCEAWSKKRHLHDKHTTIVLAIFFISLLGVGMGQTAVYTLGIPYIDDNVASRESPLYFAITIGVRILGPALGFLLGSLCTRIYVDPYSHPQVEPTDPRWVGAWWLGLVLVSSLLMLASFAMFCFPKRLKSNRNLDPRNFRPGKKNPSLRDFPKAVNRLLKNDILMCRTASSVLHILPIAGLYTFLPKYLETQFRLPAHTANMISGIGGILVMGLGIIISGVFILRVKPNARFVAAWIAFTAVVYAIGMGILMFIGCPMDDFAGLDLGRTPKFMPVCESNCQCDENKFGPICGFDNRTYFSECHAGCRNTSFNKEGKIIGFTDCQCIPLGNLSLAKQEIAHIAQSGYCEPKCQNFVWYILLFSVFVFIHSTSEVGSMLLILRCVDPRDKAMALGLIQFAIGLFGNVPCPIVYGAVVDYACMVWEENACGGRGACWLYDTAIFRMFYHGTTGVILLCAFCVDIIVWYKAGSINFVDEPNGTGQEEELNPITGRVRSETSV